MKTLNPNDFGKIGLVEECQRIRISEFLKKYKTRLKELVLSSEIDVLGIKVGLATSMTRFAGTRFWFKCPSCGRRVGVLYCSNKADLGCRSCLGLNYSKRRFKGMIEEKFL